MTRFFEIAATAMHQFTEALSLNLLKEQVLQEMVLRRLMIAIGQDEYLSKALVVTGGTALHQLLLNTPMRHSEDLDLILRDGYDAHKVANRIVSLCAEFGLKCVSKSPKTLGGLYHLRFKSLGPLEPKLKLKVEIRLGPFLDQAVTNDELIQNAIFVETTMRNDWFSGAASVPCIHPDDLAATKFHAMQSRDKPRDMGDLFLMIDHDLTTVGRVAQRHVAYSVNEGTSKVALLRKGHERAHVNWPSKEMASKIKQEEDGQLAYPTEVATGLEVFDAIKDAALPLCVDWDKEHGVSAS